MEQQKTERFCVDRQQNYWFEDISLPPLQSGEVLVAVRSLGICGSDMEYFKTGKCNIFPIKDYLVLLHEASGEIMQCADDVTTVAVGDRVALNPMRVCGMCTPCTQGMPRFCDSLFFHSSAREHPHMQGFAQRHVIVKAEQCFPFPKTMPYHMIALSEPISVCLHTLSKIDIKKPQQVVIFGAGSIGQLLAFALKRKGIKTIYMCDISDFALAQAKKTGVTDTFNMAHENQRQSFFKMAKNQPLTVGIEASGSVQALVDIINSVYVGATVVQVGILHNDTPKDTSLAIINKEIHYIGCMRFDCEFAESVSLLHQTSYEDIKHMITHHYDFKDIKHAFKTAIDTTQPSTKVMVHNESL